MQNVYNGMALGTGSGAGTQVSRGILATDVPYSIHGLLSPFYDVTYNFGLL